jgi:hypothetical protein
MMDEIDYMDEDLYDEDLYDEEYGNPMMDEMNYMDEEDTLYEVDFPESEPSSLTDEELNEMLADMDMEEGMGMSMRRNKGSRSDDFMEEDMYGESMATDTRDKFVKQGLRGPIYGQAGVDESMFEDLTMEELEEIKEMLDGDDMSSESSHQSKMHSPKDDFLSESDIEEMLDSMKDEEYEIEESMSTITGQGPRHHARPSNRAERVRPLVSEEEEMMEGDEEPLDEFFSGLKGAFGQAAAGIGKLGATAKQAVGKYATEIGQAYNSAEVSNEVKKLETLAMNLGKQVGALNSRLQKAGKQPLPAASLLTTLTNQIRSGGNISLASKNIGQAQPQGQAMQEEEVQELQEQLKKLKQEKTNLQEGFVNKVKSLENKVYDVTISALKAGFVNKFLLEHPLRENEKLEIIHRFSNAQTKEQIKETYISLTNEFAKGQTVNDGSMLNESVQNKVGKVHRTDNAIVREKNLMNENDESLRFKQLLNYNFNKKK